MTTPATYARTCLITDPFLGEGLLLNPTTSYIFMNTDLYRSSCSAFLFDSPVFSSRTYLTKQTTAVSVSPPSNSLFGQTVTSKQTSNISPMLTSSITKKEGTLRTCEIVWESLQKTWTRFGGRKDIDNSMDYYSIKGAIHFVIVPALQFLNQSLF